ncbi:MAG: hypothetical protein JOZ11_20395 [Alphaproteobacteria bacterium]|nr:hypothetical protein [Alphaproteobacteria bacterium]
MPELDVFAIYLAPFLSRLAPSIYRYFPLPSKTPRKLVRDGYNGVVAFRGYMVPRLADDGDAPSTRCHAIGSLAISKILGHCGASRMTRNGMEIDKALSLRPLIIDISMATE